MNADTVIRVEQLGKRYMISHAGRHDTLRDALGHGVRRLGHLFRTRPGGLAAGREEFWALRDIGFEVKRGEVLGIIGRNGAGKSTLLKILSRITEPTRGRIEIRGRVASLLEVGTGFHPELSGRENIFLNGAILGMSRAEIHRKFDEIVAFAEVEKFIDTPVKHYSSGMYVRLAFAVAAHLEPEILIIDEVLAVGDAQFQQKCLGKMQDVTAGDGRTVLFVSHNTAAVQNLCARGLLLDSGVQRFYGATAQALARYIHSAAGGGGGLAIDRQVVVPDSPVRCTLLKVNGSSADRVAIATAAEPLEVLAEVRVTADVRLSAELSLCDRFGNKLLLCSPGHDAGGLDTHRLTPGRHRLRFQVQLPRLFRGSYLLDFTLAQPFVCKYVRFPAAVELSVDSSGLTWGHLYENAGVPVGFMVVPGRVTSERIGEL